MGFTLATAIASGLGLRKIVIPTNPGNFSAYGMLLSGLRYDLAATHLLPLSEAGLKVAWKDSTIWRKEGSAVYPNKVLAAMELPLNGCWTCATVSRRTS
jgi:N-methylhydantoinase A/oxoprolinase/acetone carboxylase beta subunit